MPICTAPNMDTRLHVLLICKQHHIHSLITKRHYKVVQELQNFLYPTNYQDDAYKFKKLQWTTIRKQYQHDYCAPMAPKDAIAMPSFNPTYFAPQATHISTPHQKLLFHNSRCNSQNLHIAITNSLHNPRQKNYKISTTYHTLINSITTRGWTIAQIMILIIGARATTHIPSMKSLEAKPKIPITKTKRTFKQMNTSTAPYAHTILAINKDQKTNNLSQTSKTRHTPLSRKARH